jgi:phosphatidylglycerophosphate synthase
MFLSTMQLLLRCFTLFNLLWSSQIAHQIEFNQPYVIPAWFIQLPWKEPLAPAWLNLGIWSTCGHFGKWIQMWVSGAVFYSSEEYAAVAGTTIFVAAALTDWLDGYLARKVICLFPLKCAQFFSFVSCTKLSQVSEFFCSLSCYQ